MKVKRKCFTCGAEILTSKTSSRRYCSRSCSLKNRIKKGEAKSLPEGTRRPGGSGYIRIKVSGKWMFEHRLVMEQALGRKLDKRDRVHHKNGKRSDNRPENLELWKLKKDCPGVRAADYHCHGCRCSEEQFQQDGAGI
jgi:hypothetical protein